MVEVTPVESVATDASASAATFLKLMADSSRRRIFLLLMNGETCNCELVGLLGMPSNLISHHLRQLREAGLIQARRDPADRRWIYYSIDRDLLKQVHGEVGLLFDPARCRERAPDCRAGDQGCR